MDLTLDDAGVQLWIWIQIHITVVPFEGPLHIQCQSHLCLTLDEVGGELQIHICVVPFEGPGFSPIYVLPYMRSPDPYLSFTF